MPDQSDFTDSTDWLDTPLSSLAPLEAALRCQVCKDFFTTPMITSCSHTFCSLCIRRYLSQEGRCPACRESDQEIKLRRNWSIEEAATQFKVARAEVLKVAKAKREEEDQSDKRPKKRRKVEQEHVASLPERRSTRSQSRRIASQDTQMQNGYTVPSSQEEAQDTEEGSVYDDEATRQQDSGPHDGLVSCPCCNKRLKETLINSHLDRCMAGETSPSPTPVRRSHTPQKQTVSIAYGQAKPDTNAKQFERLPTINYSMLTDNALRKKFKELGIPNHGSKELLRKRHTEWMNLWNANCDSLHPVSKTQLLRDLDTWERTLGRQVDRGPSGVMIKEFDRDGWQKANKGEFDDLIRLARERKKAAADKTHGDSKSEKDGDLTEADTTMTHEPQAQPVQPPSHKDPGSLRDLFPGMEESSPINGDVQFISHDQRTDSLDLVSTRTDLPVTSGNSAETKGAGT